MRERVRFSSLRCAAIAVVTAALIGAAGLNPAALAQQAKSASIPTDDLFSPQTADFKPGAGARLVNFVKQAQTPGSQCPTDVDFTVFESDLDTLLAQARAAARREVIEGVLKGFGPSVRVTGKSTGGIISAVIITAQSAKDKEPPKLDATFTPPKGKKVKARDKITVTMVARDHANLWQSGIKTVQLVAESDGSRFIASENFPPAPPGWGCTALPPERRVVATYEVPSNPPPIVRLAALAEDHTGLMDTDIGEFPTQGDWYGTLEYSVDGVTSGVRLTIIDRADIVLDYDGKGNLTGSLVSTRSYKQITQTCPLVVTVPNNFRSKLVGSYTPGAEVMSIQLVEPVAAPPVRRDCPGGGYHISGYNNHHEWPPFKSVLGSPRAAKDGTFRSSTESTTGPYTNRISLTLRPVQN